VKLLAALLILWLPLSLAAIVAIPVSLVAVFIEWEYAKNILRAKDKLAAALLGWSGQHTISAECGASECKLCRAVCALLNMIDNGHCEGASRREGKIA
jgi:hypothetical protein